MADRIYTSRHRITYVTRDQGTGATHRSLLCDFDTLLTEPVTYGGDVAINRSSVIGSAWVRQRSVGNASVSLTFSVASVHESALEAERYGDEVPLFFLMRPIGQLLVESYPDFTTGDPTVVRRWQGSRNQVVAFPMTSDHFYGVNVDSISGASRVAWRVIKYDFTLTDPDPAPSLYPPSL